MMTDAAQASMDFLRFFDTENYDSARVRETVNTLAKTLSWAFTQGEIVSTDGSYTHRMLSNLAKPRTVVIKGQAYVIGKAGGVPTAVVGRAMARMNSFVVLVIAALRAEFPSWEVLQSFAAFDLQELTTRARDDLHRIAVTFQLDKLRLVSEYQTVLPTARALQQQGPTESNFDCWTRAWKKHGKPDTLFGALARYTSLCGCTTSGVEQLHSLQDWLWPKRRGKLGECRANDEMKIVVDAAEYDRECTLEIARGIWKKMYGTPRAHLRKRVDAGKAKPIKHGRTLSNWTRSYKAKVSRQAEKEPAHSLVHFQQSAAAQFADTWSHAMDKELDHQWAVKKEHFLQNLTDGTLLPTECTHADTDVVQARIEHLRGLRTKRKRDAAKTDRLLHPKTRGEKALPVGATVYIDPNTMTGQHLDIAQRLVAVKAMQFTDDRVGALVFVTAACDKPCAETAWALMLNGGILCDSAYFRSDGGAGSASMYKAAVTGGKRLLWVSANFKRQEAGVYDVVRRSVMQGISRWRLVDKQGFALAVATNEARGTRQRRNMDQVGLVLEQEQAALALPTYCFTRDIFLSKFRVMADSVMGACDL